MRICAGFMLDRLMTMVLIFSLVLFPSTIINAQEPVLWGPVKGGNPTGSIFKVNLDGSSPTIVKQFAVNAKGKVDGMGSVIVASDGYYYGTTGYGGDFNFGVIYRVNPSDLSYEKVHDFSGPDGRQPVGNMVEATDGMLYGVTRLGGSSPGSAGGIFKVSKDGNNFEVLHEFTGNAAGNNPPGGLIQASDGLMYGVTTFGGSANDGMIYSVDPSGTFNVVMSFNSATTGNYPGGNLIEGSDDLLYGILLNYSTGHSKLFRIATNGTGFEVIFDFADDELNGKYPFGALVEGTDGFLYGTTSEGGTFGRGAIFKVELDGSNFSKLKDLGFGTGFYPRVGLTIGSDGKLYGGTAGMQGVIFSLETDGDGYTILSSLNATTGNQVASSIAEDQNGDLVAVCSYGGKANIGTMVRVKTDGSQTEKVLDFFEPNDGQVPNDMLLTSDGYLFGTTQTGGLHGKGVIFRIDPVTGTYAKLFDFDGPSNGSTPKATLMLGADQYLYGSTYEGGALDGGVLFKLKRNGSDYTVLRAFNPSSGGYRSSAVVQDENGVLYGTCESGGQSGVIYSIHPDGGSYTVLWDFPFVTGGNPRGALTLGQDGKLYGMTTFGGANTSGVVFSINKDGSQYTTLLDFDGNNGKFPYSNFIQGADNLLYGTTMVGGSNNQGTLFKISGTTGTYTKLHDFDFTTSPNTAYMPQGALVQHTSGDLYGMAEFGTLQNLGAVFKISPSGTNYTQILEFSVANGLGLGSGSLNIVADKDHQVITFPLIGQATIGSVKTLNATSDAGIAITYSSSNTSVATVSGNQLTIVGVGTTVVRAFNSGNAEYFGAEQLQSITVTIVTPVVAIHTPDKGVVGSTITLNTYKGSSSGAVTYSVANGTGSATVTGGTLNLLSPGTVTVTTNVASDPGHNASSAQKVFTITKPTPNISFTSATQGVNGGTIPLSLNAGGSTGTVTYSVTNATGTASLSGTTLTLTSPGAVLIKASITESATFGPATLESLISINATNTQLPGKAQFWGTFSRGGNGNAGVLFRANSDGTGYAVAKHFLHPETGTQISEGALLFASDGNYYGAIIEGGRFGGGFVYRFNPANESYTPLHHFTAGSQPIGSLVQLPNGLIYGLTSSGGANNLGTIFSLDPTSGVLVTLYSFSAQGLFGMRGGLTLGSDGLLYGMTRVGGANNGGTIFSFNIAGNTFTKLVDLNTATGTLPLGMLALGDDDKLYGLTSAGGANDRGTIFEFDPAGPTFTKRVDIPTAMNGTPQFSFAVGGDGKLYSSIGNALLAFDPVSGIATKLTSVPARFTPTPAPGNKLYIVRLLVQPGLYEYDLATSTNRLLFSFALPLATSPAGNLTLLPDGKLIGLTGNGGEYDKGIIYKFDPSTFEFKTEFSFGKPGDGNSPTPAPGVIGPKLYGAAKNGHQGSSTTPGIIFEYDPATSVYSNTLFPASSQNLRGPIAHENGKMYGTANHVTGIGGYIYEYDPSTKSINSKFNFVGSGIGLSAAHSLTYFPGNKMYGYCTDGPNGAIIEFDVVTGNVVKKYEFGPPGDDGTFAESLIAGTDGMLYGAMSGGGATGDGVFFKFDPQAGSYEKLKDFGGADGGGPGVPVQHPNGKIYGFTSYGGADDAGTIYEYDPDLNTFNIIHDFNLFSPFDLQPPVVGSEGKIYGIVSVAGPIGSGAIFEFDPVSGSYTLKSTFTGQTGFYGGLSNFTLVKLTQSIAFAALPPETLATESIELDATATSGLPVTYVSSNPAVATVNGNILTIVSDGQTIITASQSGDYDFAPAPPIMQALTVTKESQAISFAPLAPKQRYDVPFSLSATSTSGLAVTFESSNTTVATVSGNTVTIVGVGTTTITATQAGDHHFDAATAVTQELVIVKATQLLTFGSIPAKTSGSAPFDLGATANSGLTVTYTIDNPNVAAISGSTVTIVGVGSAVITAHQPGDDNFAAAADVSQVLEVAKTIQTITFNALETKTYGDPPFSMVASSSSGLAVSFTSSNPNIASVSGNVVTIHTAGTVTISASQPGSAQVEEATVVSRELVVAKKTQTIAFSLAESMTFNDNDVPLSATASSGLGVTFAIDNASVAVIDDGKFSIVGAGTVTVTASQAGDINHLPASVTRTVVVAKAPQIITFGVIADKTLGTAPFVLDASSPSGLTVVYSSTSDKVTISGNTITLVRAGRPTVKASQEGNINYLAAPTVERSFCINPAKPAITVGTGENPILTSSNDDGNAWFKGGTAINGANGKTYTPIEAGTYTVRTTVDDCSSVISDPVNFVVTGFEEETSDGLSVFPNPVSDELFVELAAANHLEVVFEIFDALGRRVIRADGSTNTMVRISMEEQGSGMFFLKASADSKIYTKRLVKK